MNRLIKALLLHVVIVLSLQPAFSQLPADVKPHVTPVPPSSFQFIKYGEIPVSEYTGIPTVSVPVYTIKDGDMEFPINLSYHAGGLRVTEDATWVGLGWNLDVGSVTQIVNDRDDLDSFRKRMPDYYTMGMPYRNEFVFRHPYPFTSPTPPVYGVSEGITKANPIHVLIVFTDWYIPIDGSYETRDVQMFNAQGGDMDIVDSEPDVFKASFNGHYIEFIREDFNTGTTSINGSFKVLNKFNYKVNLVILNGVKTWKITCPDGMIYYFEQVDEVRRNCSEAVVSVAAISQDCHHDVESRVWHLTKLKNTNNDEVKFNWELTGAIQDLPSYSNKDIYSDHDENLDFMMNSCNLTGRYRAYSGQENGLYPYADEMMHGWSKSSVQPATKSYLSSIEFPLGTITFKKSSRLDKVNDLKLDSIMVRNQSRLVKKFNFSYDYFIATENGGSWSTEVPISPITISPAELTHRLKLLSFGEEGTPTYKFTYDPTQLPRKTSFAIDYWGFYNGKITNTSFVPNPIHLNLALSDNGNDRRAVLNNTKACTLTGIKYPTGGSTDFNYELNTFTYVNPQNPTSEGMGLRVKTVVDAIPGRVATTTKYSYEAGRSINEMEFFAQYSMLTIQPPNGGLVSHYYYLVKYLSGNNFYQSALLGSGNFIGYDKVTKERVDTDGIPLGKIVSYYSNHPDIGKHDATLDISLPARKDKQYPENGALLSQEVFDANGNLQSLKVNKYRFIISDPYYGVRIASTGLLVFKGNVMGEENGCHTWEYSQDLAAYYPLYSGETVLDSTRTEEYEAGRKMVTRKQFTYYSNNLRDTETDTNSKGEIITTKLYYPTDTEAYTRNIFNTPVRSRITKSDGSVISDRDHTYAVFNGLRLLTASSEKIGTFPSYQGITFSNYDTFGNPLDYKQPSNANQAVVWGYKQSLPIAEVTNALSTQIAYSGFETSQDFGGWTYTHQVSSTKKTGLKGFTGTSISKSGLPSGNYVISFWARRNTANGSVSGTVTTSLTSDTWQYFSYTVNSITAVTLNLSNVIMDDLRLYPVGAQMTTYTHDPLVGVTSTTDVNNVSTFYEYDINGRLQSLRDEAGNIVKTYTYHFKN